MLGAGVAERGAAAGATVVANRDTEAHVAVAKQEDAKRPEKPIKENIIYSRNARIVTDIHGGSLDKLIDKRQKDALVVINGDVIDDRAGGGNSWTAVKQVMDLVNKGQGVLNFGNHELLFMAAMQNNAEAFQTWIMNGGYETAKAAGVDMKAYDAAIVAKGGLNAFYMDDAARNAALGALLPLIIQNQNLNQYSDFLIANGKTYTIVDNVLITHAGILADPATGELKEVIIDGKSFGKGLEAMDNIQEAIRNRDQNVIVWLANHGGSDKLNGENPFWVRDTNFQEVIADPVKAHALRKELNDQVKGKALIELVVVGHSKTLGDTSFQTLPRPSAGGAAVGATQSRFVGIDVPEGEFRAVDITVGDNGKAAVKYKDPTTGQVVQDAAGKAVVDMKIDVDAARIPKEAAPAQDAAQEAAAKREAAEIQRILDKTVEWMKGDQKLVMMRPVLESIAGQLGADTAAQRLQPMPGETQDSYDRRGGREKKVVEQAERKLKQLQKDNEKKKNDNNAPPEQRLLAYDIDLAQNTKDLHEAYVHFASLPTEDTPEYAQAKERVEQLALAKKTLQEERGKIGTPEQQGVNYAAGVVMKLMGDTPLTDDQKKAIVENPLQFLEGQISNADSFNKLLANSGLDTKQQRQLQDLASAQEAEKTVRQDVIKAKAKEVGAVSLLSFFVLLYAASKKKEQ